MALIFVRTVIIFATLLFVMRLMGKRQIGEMQPFDLVITLIVADLACIPMADTSIPLLYGIIAISTIYFLHQIVCFLDLKFNKMKSLLSGSPSVVLNKDGICDKELKRNNLDVSDLVESMRGAGYFSLDAVDYALYEANGSFSALPKQNYEDKQTSMPVIIIDEGKVDKVNLEKTGRPLSYFSSVLEKHGVKNTKDVLILTCDGVGKIYCQKRGEKYFTEQLDWKENLW